MTEANKPYRKNSPSALRTPKHERGQILPLALLAMGTFFCFCGYVIDIGRVYIGYQQLQASTDAAAMAGGEALGQPNANPGSNAQTVAGNYSSSTGDANTFSNLTSVTTTTTPKCLATLASQGIPCNVSLSPALYNAVQVKQTAVVQMSFAHFFGTSTVPITAVATASAAGAATTPYNVAIIIDSTASMADSDGGSNCSSSRLTCALSGVQTLLGELYPCASSQSTCSTTNGVAAYPVDQVSIFTFPNMTTTTASAEYDCSGSTSPTINPYIFPPDSTSNPKNTTSPSTMPYTTSTTSNGHTTTTTVTMTYQVTPFLSDYRASDTSSGLATSSNLSLTIGAKSGCTGMSDPGGDGTYYAGAIYAAQAALQAQAATTPGSQNVIILLSDGDASSCGTLTQSGCTKIQMAEGTTSTTIATSSGTYPSWIDQCSQAITAAKAAAGAGTRVYAVAYGAESSGCSTDTSGTYSGYTPCQTMQAIASSPAYFYSDYSQGGTGVDKSCISSANSTSNLNQIFQDIATSFTVARLIPNSTT